MKYFAVSLLLAFCLAACSDDAPNTSVVKDPSLSGYSDSLLLTMTPAPAQNAVLEGVWTDLPMTVGRPTSVPPQFFFCQDSAAHWEISTKQSKYVRSRDYDLRILDDGRVWFDAFLYTGGPYERESAIRFCGTIIGDTLRGSAFVFGVVLGERIAGGYNQRWSFLRQR